jgi:hypothetical protein
MPWWLVVIIFLGTIYVGAAVWEWAGRWWVRRGSDRIDRQKGENLVD